MSAFGANSTRLFSSKQYGLIVLLHQTLLNSGTVILLPKFDLPQFCSAVQKHKATVALIVPPIALGIAKHPIVDEYDLKSLRFMMSGAAPLSESLQQAVTDRLGKKGGKTLMLQGWGMTGESLALLLTARSRKADR